MLHAGSEIFHDAKGGGGSHVDVMMMSLVEKKNCEQPLSHMILGAPCKLYVSRCKKYKLGNKVQLLPLTTRVIDDPPLTFSTVQLYIPTMAL